MRVGRGHGGAVGRPLGVEDGALALPVDEVVEARQRLGVAHVPHEQLPVVAGRQQHARQPRVRLQHVRLVVVPRQRAHLHTHTSIPAALDRYSTNVNAVL